MEFRNEPYYMGIDPTSICQLRCPSCPTGVENESRRIGPRQHLAHPNHDDVGSAACSGIVAMWLLNGLSVAGSALLGSPSTARQVQYTA